MHGHMNVKFKTRTNINVTLRCMPSLQKSLFAPDFLTQVLHAFLISAMYGDVTSIG